MIISKRELLASSPIKLVDANYQYQDLDKKIDGFIKLDKCNVVSELTLFNEQVIAVIKVQGTITLKSTRTLKPVTITFKDEDSFTFSFEPVVEEESDWIYISGTEIDLNPYIIDLIALSIPLKVVGKNEPINFAQDNYEVISEDEYNRRKNESDSRFAGLKDLFDE